MYLDLVLDKKVSKHFWNTTSFFSRIILFLFSLAKLLFSLTSLDPEN